MPILVLLLCAFVIGQAFWGYKLRYFYRIFPGFLAGLLISFTTGFLMFMNGVRGDLVRGGVSVLEKFGIGGTLANEILSGDILGVLQILVKSEDARNALMKILPDSAKAFIVLGVLVCVACTIACAALEKPGVFLELFAYGYTFVASLFAAMDSAFLGAVLGIVAGALLGALGYKISRGWIIVAPNVVNFIVVLFAASSAGLLFSVPSGSNTNAGSAAGVGLFLIPLVCLATVVAIPIGVRKQFKETAATKDGAAQPAAASSGGLKSKLAAKFKSASAPASGTDFVPVAPSARPDADVSESAPQTGGPKFCPQCGSSLAPGAKFCTKCGASTQGRG